MNKIGYNEAIGFGAVAATSSAGGSDTAYFYDTTGNDTYTSQNDTSSMTGHGYSIQATGFATNDAFFSSGTDVANLGAGTARADFVFGNASDTVNFISSAASDLFIGEYPYSIMQFANNSYEKQATGFGKVNATATTSGATAYLYDSPNNDAVVVGGTAATLTMPGVVIGVKGYSTVFAYGTNGGSNTQHVTAHSFVFNAIGSWTSV